MSERNPLDFTAAFKALGDPTRLRIFDFLCRQCCPVAVEDNGDVRPVLGPTVGAVCCHVTGAERINSTISHHLKGLPPGRSHYGRAARKEHDLRRQSGRRGDTRRLLKRANCRKSERKPPQ